MLAIPLHGLPNYALADLALPVLAASPLSVDATADSATVTGTTVGVDATPANGTAPYAYAWTVTSEPSVGAAVFDDDSIAGPTVTFSEAGSYTFSVTVTDDDANTATDTVSVTVVQTATGITVSPATQSLYQSTAKQFTHAQVDQFGDAMGTPEAVTWSVDGGGVGGSVNSSGLYTAPASDGSDTVRATTNTTAIADTSAVTVGASGGGGIDPPESPLMSLLTVLCLDENGMPEADVEVDLRIVTVPTGDTNIAYKGNKKTGVSDANGIAMIEAPRGSRCQIKRGPGADWKTIAIADAASTDIESIIGSP
jgi:hypothetical protein